MIDLSEWQARLQATGAWKHIGGAAGIAQAQAGKSPQTPAAYVVRGPVRPEQTDESTGGVTQFLIARVGVVHAVRVVSDSRGEAGQAELDTLIQTAMDTLVGWEPTGADGPVTYQGGDWLELGPTLWWMDNYETRLIQRG